MSMPYDQIGGETTSPVPASATSSSSISYQTNVNRQKTTKWATAKSADYGADDWGDDFEEYNPPPLFKPTGVRQPGQAVQSDSLTSPINVKKAYGDLPTTPADSQWRSTTAPIQQQWMGPDAQRAASQGQIRQPIASSVDALQQKPLPALQVITQPAITGLRKAVQTTPPADSPNSQVQGKRSVAETPQSGIGSSVYSDDRATPADYTSRANYSPAAAPPPLQSRFSPVAQSPFEPPATKFTPPPPRKTSMSSQAGSEVSSPSLEGATPKPWAAARSSSPSSSTRSSSAQGKPLPHIRPVDIYKRMEEERERERQSLDTGRPNVGPLQGGSNSRDQSDSPAKSLQPTRHNFENTVESVKPAPATDYGEIDDGRRARAIVEPVKETKSEPRFAGSDTNNSAIAGKLPEQPVPKINMPDQAEEEENDNAPRFSTTPMLPDLNRISMFGMDMFSQTKDETIPAVPDIPSQIQAQSLASKSLASRHYGEEITKPNLQPQTSPGFSSIVHQAFENPNDLSVPHTPIGGGVKRTDSESTGTTGISPIMSRVPSTTNRETKSGEVDGRDTTPAIAEETEPHSNRSSSQLPALPSVTTSALPQTRETESVTPHSFHTGQRSEMTPPSPGTVLARTPTVTNSLQYPAGEEGQISAATESAVSSEAELENARPTIERDPSFRPALPGGWVSYATSTQDDSSEQQKREKRPESPVSSVSHPEVSRDDDVNVAPHTAKQSLPSSTLGVVAGVAGVALGGAAVAAKLNKQDTSGPPRMPDISKGPWAMSGNKSLQTPDPALAPVSNPYSSAALDPRLTSPENGTAAEKLQIPQNDGQATTSSAPPTPPPKDTPSGEPLRGQPEYFPAPNPLKLKTQGNLPASESITSIRQQPHMLPALSTQASPHDLESDRLRKEIVMSLSPTNAQASQSQISFGNDNLDQGHLRDNVGQPNSPRESNYLPSEYDNYWASSDEPGHMPGNAEEHDVAPMSAVSDMSQSSLPHNQRDEQRLANEETAPVAPAAPVAPVAPVAAVAPVGPVSPLAPVASVAPVAVVAPLPPSAPSAQISPRSADAQFGTRPPMSQNRFSWEKGSEQVTTPAKQLKQLNEAGESAPEGTQILAPSKQSISDPPQQQIVSPTARVPPSPLPENQHARHATETAIGVGGLTALAAAAYVGHESQNQEPQRRLSPTGEKSPATTPTYAGPSEAQHPSRSTEKAVTPSTLIPPDNRYTDTASVSPISTVATVAPVAPVAPPEPQRQQVSDMSKISKFSDILSNPNAEFRIRAYNDSRDQFAVMETGLSDWLRDLSSRFTEPSGARPGFGFAPGPGGPLQSRPGKPTDNPMQPLQQPYYQQYLNASSPTLPGTPNSRPPTSNPSGFQQGPSPSGGKQGQTKTKIKGLFKFRGGDKMTPSPQQTPPENSNKMGQAWEASNAQSRFSGGASSQGSGERTPSHESHSRAPSRAEPSSLQSGALAVEDNRRGAESVSSISTLPVRDEDRFSREEARDSLSVPAPIGKHQPTWDPTNATPIAEEEGFQLDEQQQRGPQPPTTGASRQRTALALPTTSPRTDRSGSSGDVFVDAADEQNSDDWVLVSKAEEAGLVTSNVERPTPRTPAMLDKEEEEGLSPAALRPAGRQSSSSHSREPSGVSSSASVSTIPPEYRTLPGQLDQQQLYNTESKAPNVATRQQPQVYATETPISTNENRDQAPATSSGFVPLPPIRRNSTFDVGKAFASTIDGDSNSAVAAPGVVTRDVNPATVRTVSSDYSNSGTALLQNPSAPQTMTSGNNDRSMQYPTQSAISGSQSGQVQASSDQRAPSAASQQRPSLEGRHERTSSWTNHRPTDSISSQVSDRSQVMQRPNSMAQRPFEQHPSSAQRHPEQFRPDQPGNQALDNRGQMQPGQYYQQPLSREEAFLPRQQTNEYSLQGVGPPDDYARTNNDGDKKKKRASILGTFHLGSSDPKPELQRRESMGPYMPGSRTNSMPPPGTPNNPTPEKKRGFFGNKTPRTSTSDSLGPLPSGGSPNNLSRTSTAEPSPSQSGGKKSKLSKTSAADNSSPAQPPATKKNRFSGLSNILGRSSIDRDDGAPAIDNAVKNAQDPSQYQRPLNYNQMQQLGQDPRNMQKFQAYPGPQGPQGPQNQPGQAQGFTGPRAPLALHPIGQGPPAPMAQQNYQGPGPMQAPNNAGGFSQVQQGPKPMQYSQDPRMLGQQPPGQQPLGQHPQVQQPPLGQQPLGQQQFRQQQQVQQQQQYMQQQQVQQPLGQQQYRQQQQVQQLSGPQSPGQQPLGQQQQVQQPQGQQLVGQQQYGQQQQVQLPQGQQPLKGQPVRQLMPGFQDPRTLQASPVEARQQTQPKQDPRLASGAPPSGQPFQPSQDPRLSNQAPPPRQSMANPQDARVSSPVGPTGLGIQQPQDQRSMNQIPASIRPVSGPQDPKLLNQMPSPGAVHQGQADPRLSGSATSPGQQFLSQDQRNSNQMPAFGGPIQGLQDPRQSNHLSSSGPATQLSPQHSTGQAPPAISPVQVSPGQRNFNQFPSSQASQDPRQERRSPPQAPLGSPSDPRILQQQTPQLGQTLGKPQFAPLGAEEFPMRPGPQSAAGFGAPNQGMKSAQTAPGNVGLGIGQVTQQPPTQPPQETRKKGSKFFGGLLGKKSKAEPPTSTQIPQSAQTKFNPQQQPQQRVDPRQQPQQRFDAGQQPQQRFDAGQQPQQRFDASQQPQQRFDGRQQPQQSPNNFDARQDGGRGRPIMREAQYGAPPNPGGYEAGRGEGYLAPTNYNTQGPIQPLQPHHRQLPSIQGPYLNNPQQYSDANLQAGSGDSQDKRSPRPLSSDDVLARSPARPQFGQQRPYQLSLPNEDNELSPNGQRPTAAERAMSPNGPSSNPPIRGFVPNGMLNNQQPLVRHPQSPATYPLPESAFSPINPAAQNFPNPPAPQWPVPQARDRGMSNPETSPVSQLSGRPQSLATVHASPQQKLSIPPLSQSNSNTDEDIYSASPRVAAPTLPVKSPRRSQEARRSTDSIPGVQGPQQRAAAAALAGIVTTVAAPAAVVAAADPAKEERNLELERDQEEKILWDPEGATEVRPPTPEPIMSATSYPGDEWNPYGLAVDGDEFD